MLLHIASYNCSIWNGHMPAVVHLRRLTRYPSRSTSLIWHGSWISYGSARAYNNPHKQGVGLMLNEASGATNHFAKNIQCDSPHPPVGRWQVAPWFLLRMTGFPLELMYNLTFTDTL